MCFCFLSQSHGPAEQLLPQTRRCDRQSVSATKVEKLLTCLGIRGPARGAASISRSIKIQQQSLEEMNKELVVNRAPWMQSWQPVAGNMVFWEDAELMPGAQVELSLWFAAAGQ